MTNDLSKHFEVKIIFLSCFTIFLSLLDVNIVNISYPVLSHIFGVTISGIAVVGMSFLFTLSLILPLSGQISDLIGAKKSVLFGYFILISSAVLCALSSSVEQLAFFRAMQGVGAAFLSIASTSILIIYIPVQRRGSAFGYLATSGALGLMLGAPIGGMLSGYFMWQSIFLATIPASLLAMFFYYIYLPDSQEQISFKEVLKSLDFRGFLLVSVGLGSYIYAMELFIKGGGELFFNIFLVVCGFSFIFVFARYEMGIKNPLIDFKVFKNHKFSFILIANVFTIMVLSVNNFTMPFYLMQVLKLSPQYTGMMMLIFSFSYGFFSLFSGRFSDKINPYILCLFGMVLAVVSVSSFLYMIDVSSLYLSIAFLSAYGLSFALFIPPANSLALSVASKANAGSTTAIFRTTRQIASLMGIVSVGLLTNSASGKMVVSDFKNVFGIEILMSIVSMLLIIYLILKRQKDEKELCTKS